MKDIKTLRKLYNISQSEFARRFDISVRTLQQWEQGKSTCPKPLISAIYEIYLRENNADDYEILYKDILLKEVLVSKNKKEILVINKSKDLFLKPFKDDLSIYDFYIFLKSRCYEDNRDDLDDILKQANLPSNNPYEFIKVSHGVTWEDYFWIRNKNENITWEEVRVRE